MKLKFIAVLLIFATLAAFIAPVAAAQPVEAPRAIDIGSVLAALFSTAFFVQIASITGMIAADWGLGVALAVRAKKFEFSKLADFYMTSIIPMLIGWAIFSIIIRAAGYFALKDLSAAFPDSVAMAAYGIVLISIVAQVAGKTKELFGQSIVPQGPVQ